MARIAIFCDGTWNSATMIQPTHVVRLFDFIRVTDDRHSVYFTGVGTGSDAPGALSRVLAKIGGGAIGWGLNDDIKKAYAYLCETYRAGDEIFIFGFSRGAYTAR